MTQSRVQWLLALLIALLASLSCSSPAIALSVSQVTSASKVGTSTYDAATHGARDDSASRMRRGPPMEAVGAACVDSDSASAVGVAANAERGVAMGRNMADRVISYAEKNGLDWYKGTPGWVPRTAIEKVSPRALEKTDLWFNKRWINSEMRGGSRIVDIGEPPGYPPSPFYNMERQQVSGYWNYVQDIQP